jgi:co-chaperonin GroES (HSP10)
VFATPVSTSYKFDVKKGDKVWFHHFVANKESKVNYLDEGDIYSTSIDNIYLRERDGELKSLHHWNFIEQIYEDEDSIKTKSGIYIKPEVEEITHSGIVRYISDSLKEMGVNVNDKIMFTKDSEYNMDINGDKLMRMRDVDILCTYE